MKLQVGDIFVEIGTNNFGLVVCRTGNQYLIEWTFGTKARYTKSEISHWVDGKKLIHYPVVK